MLSQMTWLRTLEGEFTAAFTLEIKEHRNLQDLILYLKVLASVSNILHRFSVYLP